MCEKLALPDQSSLVSWVAGVPSLHVDRSLMCVGLGEEKVGLRGMGFQPAFTEAIRHRERLHDMTQAEIALDIS